MELLKKHIATGPTAPTGGLGALLLEQFRIRTQREHVIKSIADSIPATHTRERLLDSVDRAVQNFYDEKLIPSVRDPDVLRAVHSVIALHQITGIEQGTPQYNEMRELSIQRSNFFRAIMLHLIRTRPETLGLTQVELLEYRHFMEMGPHVDQWLVEYMSHLHDGTVSSPNPWTVFRMKGGQLTEMTFGEAFPVVFQIGDMYTRLADEIERVVDERNETLIHSKVTYYRACANLYHCLDPRKLEGLLYKADRYFAEQGGDVVTHHSMETAYIGDSTRREPDFGIRLLRRDSENARRLAAIEQTRTDMQSGYTAHLSGKPDLISVRGTVRSFNDLRIGCYHFHGGGLGSINRFASQTLPNAPETVRVSGLLLFLDPDAANQRLVTAKQYARDFFGRGETDRLLEEVTLNRVLIAGYSGQSMGYGLGKFGGVYQRLTEEEIGKVDDWKASAVMLVGRYLKFRNDREEDFRPLRWRAMMILIDYFRNCRRATQDAARPHYLSGRIHVRLMEEVGILVPPLAGTFAWKVDMSGPKLRALFEKYEAILDELMRIYERGGARDVRAFLATYNKDSRFDRDVRTFFGITLTHLT